jgi:hypothetical protein
MNTDKAGRKASRVVLGGPPAEFRARPAVGGDTFTAGLFRDGSGALDALLVNRDYRYGARPVLALRTETAPPEVFDDATRRWSEARDAIPLVAPGDALLLRWRPR